MNRLILCLCLSAIIISCRTAHSKDPKKSLLAVGEKHLFKSIINGNWVESSYINQIRKTKSPYNAQDSLGLIVELVIDTNRMKGDSLKIIAPSVHEIWDFQVYFRPGTTPKSLPTNIEGDKGGDYYELGYSITNSDTSLTVCHYNNAKELLTEKKLIKAPKSPQDALETMINTMLFAGQYETYDSTGHVMNIEFSPDGTVMGFPLFNKYFILTDFVAESYKSFDQICFDIQSKNQHCFAFEIKADTINLYGIIATDISDSVKRGDLKYKLVKR